MEGEKSGENHDFSLQGYWMKEDESTGLSAETQMVLDGLGAGYCKWSLWLSFISYIWYYYRGYF